MRQQANSVAAFLLGAIAVAWPWGAYQYVPAVDAELVVVLAIPLLVTLFICLPSSRRFNLPFELLWPLVALLSCVVLEAFGSGGERSGDWALSILFFWATACFSRSKSAVETRLWWMTVSIGVVALVSLFARMFGVVPTAYSLDSHATLAFPYTISGGLMTLCVGLVLAIGLTLHRQQPLHRRRIAAMCAVVIVVATMPVMAAELKSEGDWHLPVRDLGGFVNLSVALLVLWLMVRVMAKLVVDYLERPSVVHLTLLGMIIVMIVFVLVSPMPVKPACAFLLGLACGYALPRSDRRVLTPYPRLCWVTLVILVPLNMFDVYPEHRADPRNYEVAAQHDFRGREFQQLMRRLAYFEAVSPYEKRTHLWRARVAILDRDLKTAADEFCSALGNDSRALLPGATPGEQADLIVRLRDLAGMVPEADGGLAYEKALAATGEVSGAVSALRLRAWPVNLAFADLDGAPMAGLVELLMESKEVGEEIAQWEPERLVALLGKIGAEVRPMPDGINPAASPIVTFWELRNNRYMLCVASPSGRVSRQGTLREDGRGPVALSWGPPVARSEDGWRVELRGEDGTVRASVACPGPDGLPEFTGGDELVVHGNDQLRVCQITIWAPFFPTD